MFGSDESLCLYIYWTSSPWAASDTMSILKQSKTGFNSEFSIS